MNLRSSQGAVSPSWSRGCRLVTFLDGGTPLGASTLRGGVATLTTGALSVASHQITAVYGGDADDQGSSSGAVSQVVNKDGSTVVLNSSANPSVFNQTVSFIITVTAAAPGSGTPTGTVQFQLDGTNFGAAVTMVGGTATSGSISTLKIGSHTVTANYGGDKNFTATTAPSFTQAVNKDNTTTRVATTTNPSVFGQSVSFTATVSAVAPGTAVPSGSVAFYDGATKLGSATLAAGVVTLGTTKLPTGQDPITAVYSGNATLATSTSAVLTRTVVASSSNPAVFGQAVTFSATMTVKSPGSGTPPGTVTFMDGTNPIDTGTLTIVNGSDVATFATAALAVGSHSITAVYGGDGSFLTSTSATLSQRVDQASTVTTVRSSANPSVVNQSVTFGATVDAASP